MLKKSPALSLRLPRKPLLPPYLALLPWLGVVAFGAFGLFGLAGLTPVLFRRKADPGEVAADERDRAISQQAAQMAGIASHMAFIIACMVPWFVHMLQAKKAITIHALPWIVFAGMFVFHLTQAAMTLVLYGREVGHGEN